MALPTPTSAGFAVDGAEVEVYTLASASGGLALDVMTYGGVVLALRTPDRDGALADVALGFAEPADYRTNDPRFGALIGRFANRIADARCTVDGRAIRLTANDGPHCLHGGASAFEHVVWDAEPFARDGARGLVLRHTSPDGAGGFPGDLAVTVTYTVTDADAWAVEYRATTTAPTPVNLTQHTYLDFSGGGIAGHRLTSPADRYVPTDADGIPLADAPRPVAGTPFDVRSGAVLGDRIGIGHPQVAQAGGLDHSLLIPGDGLRLAARLEDPASGRVLTLSTTEPAVQVYTGNHLGGVVGKGGVYRAHDGVALEAQHPPDAPNRPGLPPTVLRPGEVFASRTVYAFSVARGGGAP